MQTYELAYSGSSLTGPLVVVTLIATSRPFSLLEFGVYLNAGTVVGNSILGVPASNGVGSAGTTMQAIDPSDAAGSAAMVTGAFATTQPTAPANPFRQFGFSATGPAGQGEMWAWEPGELIVPTGGQLVLWMTAGTATLRGYAKVGEGG